MQANRIAIEEHFWTPELRELRRGHDVLSDPELGRRLAIAGQDADFPLWLVLLVLVPLLLAAGVLVVSVLSPMPPPPNKLAVVLLMA